MLLMMMMMMMVNLQRLSVIGEISQKIKIVARILNPFYPSHTQKNYILEIHFNIINYIFEVLTFREG